MDAVPTIPARPVVHLPLLLQYLPVEPVLLRALPVVVTVPPAVAAIMGMDITDTVDMIGTNLHPD